MARTGQTLKNIFDNAEEILDKTVLTYKENCVIPGYEIALQNCVSGQTFSHIQIASK